MENKIEMLPTFKLLPHPDNPRKDIDEEKLNELAASIKENGILQNLTVVPYGDMYRVLIGHRRLEAAKLIGLGFLPCLVSDMDYKTQIATMICENMQRADLTVVEQAQGIKSLFDLGETADSIAKKTGLSRSTVERRRAVASLPADKVTTAINDGMRLEDIIEVNKIKDDKQREKCVNALGTNNFNYIMSQAKEEEKAEERRAQARQLLNGIANEVNKFDYNVHESIKEIWMSQSNWLEDLNELVKTLKDDERESFFCFGKETWDRSRLKIFRNIPEDFKKAQSEKAAKERIEYDKRAARKEALSDKERQFTDLKKEFCKRFRSASSFNPLARKFFETVNDYFDKCEVFEFLGFDVDDYEEWELLNVPEIKELWDDCPERVLLASCIVTWNEDLSLWDYYGRYNLDEDEQKRALDFLYFLRSLGYRPSDEEISFYSGKDELYVKE